MLVADCACGDHNHAGGELRRELRISGPPCGQVIVTSAEDDQRSRGSGHKAQHRSHRGNHRPLYLDAILVATWNDREPVVSK